MVNIILYIALGIAALAIILSLIRFMLGRTIFDRTAAIDVMTVSSIGIIGIIAYFTERAIYLDVAVVYGLLSFVGVIIIAKYLEKGL
jgi:multicomponent Na+:H+ antiporter subunit F